MVYIHMHARRHTYMHTDMHAHKIAGAPNGRTLKHVQGLKTVIHYVMKHFKTQSFTYV